MRYLGSLGTEGSRIVGMYEEYRYSADVWGVLGVRGGIWGMWGVGSGIWCIWGLNVRNMLRKCAQSIPGEDSRNKKIFCPRYKSEWHEQKCVNLRLIYIGLYLLYFLVWDDKIIVYIYKILHMDSHYFADYHGFYFLMELL